MSGTLTEACFNQFLSLIHDLTGITISKNRSFMVEGRLKKRITALKLASYEEYLERVRKDTAEQILFIDVVTTNETYFFRTPRIWDCFENKFLSGWYKKFPGRTFRAWSAAASSGEEAHSAGVICQKFKMKHPSFDYQIVGTDISQEMVGLCQKGQYMGKSIDGFQKMWPELFKAMMKATANGHFQAISEIKSRIKFHQHNLFKAYPSTELFDLILVRNVLIYFTAPDQEKVLNLMASKLSPDGLLIIGESESLSHIKTPYKQLEPLVYHLDKAKEKVA